MNVMEQAANVAELVRESAILGVQWVPSKPRVNAAIVEHNTELARVRIEREGSEAQDVVGEFG